MNILITGIHGFVGTNLVNALKSHHTIYGLDIIFSQKDGVNKTFSWKDLDNLPEIDVIIHLAGKAHDTKKQSAAQIYFDINTGLTKLIFNYYLQSPTKKFIFFSSVKAAADTVVGDMLTEKVIPFPKGPYGESKIQAENYIKEKLNVDGDCWHLDGGKSVYIIRPCMIHGPGNKGNLNLLYSVIKKGIPWPLGAFQNHRSFTSIDNLCFVIEGLITKNVQSGIYHMGDDKALSTNELIKIMCSAMGQKSRIWNLNVDLLKGLAKVGDCLRLPLNSDRLGKLTENYVVSNTKIKMALGINNMPVSAEEGISKTILSFQHKN